jgi:hypothetical protein
MNYDTFRALCQVYNPGHVKSAGAAAGLAQPRGGLAGDVEDGVDIARVEVANELARLLRG